MRNILHKAFTMLVLPVAGRNHAVEYILNKNNVTLGAGFGVEDFLIAFSFLIFFDVFGYFYFSFVLDQRKGATFVMINLPF